MTDDTGYRCNIQPGYVDGEELGEKPGPRQTLIVELVADGLEQLVEDLERALSMIDSVNADCDDRVRLQRLQMLYDCLKAWSDG